MSSESVRSTVPVAIAPTAGPLQPKPPAVAPWRGTTIMFHHHPDGTVSATSRGLVAAGATEGQALRELLRLIKESERIATVDTLRILPRNTTPASDG